MKTIGKFLLLFPAILFAPYRGFQNKFVSLIEADLGEYWEQLPEAAVEVSLSEKS